MTASPDAVANATRSKFNASRGRGAITNLTGLGIVVVIYRDHAPEPLFGLPWAKDALDYAEWGIAAMLLSLLTRVAFLKGKSAVRALKAGFVITVATADATISDHPSTDVARGDDGRSD